jgi:hypothetical protein
MSKVKVIHTPTRHRGRDPKPPPWWRSFWLRTGTVVEYRGVRWICVVVGAADQSWRQWVRDPSADDENRS